MFRSPANRMIEASVQARIPRSIERQQWCETHRMFYMPSSGCPSCMAILPDTGTKVLRPVWPEGAEL